MKDKYLYYIEIICVIFLICFAFFMFVNIKRVYSDNKADNNVKNTNNYDSSKYHKINDY